MVSVIITTFKRNSEIVERAILSVINQTYKEIEIIIIDDNLNGSSFSSEVKNLIENYKFVKYYKVDGNKGACFARNLGISKANGEYIAFLDDDDTWENNKIEKQIRVFEKEKKDTLGMVYCCGLIFYDDTQKVVDYFNCVTFKENVTFNDLLKQDYIGSTSQPLIRKKCFDDCGFFDVNQPARQDYEMWLRISQKYEIKGIANKLFTHHMHSQEQISKNKNLVFRGYVNIYKEFKKEYSQNKTAENNILNRIISAKTKENQSKIIYYKFLRFIKYHFR